MGFTNISLTPNRELHRSMTKEAFLNLCHPFQPFILGQKTIGPRVVRLGIPLVMYGESPRWIRYSEAMKPTMPPKYFTSDPNLLNASTWSVSVDEWRRQGAALRT